MSLQGILPVIPTPFVEGSFDRESFTAMLERMEPYVDGYVLLGSTGEAPSLDVASRQRIAEFALSVTHPSKAVVVGVTSTCLGDSIALAQHAQARGAAGVLCAAPFYFANSDEGMLEFFRGVDAALDVDLVLYDNPAATKTVLGAQTVIEWAESLQHLRTVKLTDQNLSKVRTWQAAGLKVMAGDDAIAFRYLAEGVDGAMIIAPVVFPVEFREMWDLLSAGRMRDAWEIFARVVAPFLHVFGIGDEIATTKALFQSLGVFTTADVLPPLRPATSERTALLRAAFDGVQTRTA